MVWCVEAYLHSSLSPNTVVCSATQNIINENVSCFTLNQSTAVCSLVSSKVVLDVSLDERCDTEEESVKCKTFKWCNSVFFHVARGTHAQTGNVQKLNNFIN